MALIVSIIQDTEHRSVNFHTASHIFNYIAELRSSVGPSQSGGVAQGCFYIGTFLQPIRKAGDTLFILIVIEHNNGVSRGKYIRDWVVILQRIDGFRHSLQETGTQEQHGEASGQRFTQPETEGGCSPHGNMQLFFCRFPDQAIKEQNEPREDGKDAQHTDEDTFCQDDAQVHPDFEAHEYQHQKAHHGGHAAAGYGGKGVGQGFLHGLFFVRKLLIFLAVAVHEDNGIIHRKHQLQDSCHRVGYGGDTTQENIRPQIDKHSHAYGGHEEERFRPGTAHDKQNNHQQSDGCNQKPGGNIGRSRIVVFDGYIIPCKSFCYCGFNGTLFWRTVVICGIDHIESAVFLVILFAFCIVCDAIHIRDLRKRSLYILFFSVLQIPEHNADCLKNLCIGKFFFHKIHADFHGRIVRQIFCHIGVDIHSEGEKTAHGGNAEDDPQKEKAFVYNEACYFFHKAWNLHMLWVAAVDGCIHKYYNQTRCLKSTNCCF